MLTLVVMEGLTVALLGWPAAHLPMSDAWWRSLHPVD